ncbi:TspO/MBR family protein [Halorientalis regularis]|jgi:benzodiazapine receptor|uniref:TspO and MBR related proteins n=1 Tax=Halorientalis regularis TaxID=660518 RepID=A0A1G7GXN1_9EURY|nr:TspO/MBR family protein [Halorientalis regularis]SDE92865.1 TspO and MBR related proteins [Halorientalis regularis]
MADITVDTTARFPQRRPAASLVLVVLASELLGGLGNLLSLSGVTTWYPTLTKPAFTPPGWVFGPVWITLFALMGVAAWLVWRAGLDDRTVRIALALFAGQFAFNVAWSGAFFGLRSPLLGLVVIAVLWLTIVATVLAFDRVDRRAALLLVPYLLWVSFAALLNYELWRLN